MCGIIRTFASVKRNTTTKDMTNGTFLALLRFSLGIDENFPYRPTAEEWGKLYACARRQSLVGVTYCGVSRLSEEAQTEIPQQIAMQWAYDAEVIAGNNDLQNHKAARLTTDFEQYGHHTVILKGQANARLYPNPLSRQPGDIDIYVDGGSERAEATLKALGMADGAVNNEMHHIHLLPDADGIEVEVHFMPFAGNFNPETNQRLRTYLLQQLASGTELCDAGFRIPSTAFALAMQLAHISRHILEGGVGLRQVTDYYLLLRSATDDERRQLAAKVEELGLRHVAKALMWVLAKVFRLPKEKMLVKPDSWRGRWLLHRILGGGNFGWYAKPRSFDGAWNRFYGGRRYAFSRIWFCPEESHNLMREERHYWWNLFVTIPQRIRNRSLTIN